MTTARDIMTAEPICVRASDTALDAAKTMAREDVGSLPICGEDDRLKGMLTDRDIVVKVLAEGKDPRAVHAGELGQGTPVWVDVDTDAAAVLDAMKEHQVRRLPVIENNRLVGIVAQADVARVLDKPRVGDLLGVLSRD
jgi:CBS domain-containing protein